MFGPAFCLAGDSFPRNSHIDEALHKRIAATFSPWVDQQEILDRTGEQDFHIDTARRLMLLEQIIPTGEDVKRTVLIGRSSGARVASLFAMGRGVAAVICLGYPFRPVHSVLEPERFAHLARITVPTLILQGYEDEYGGVDLTEHYALSPAVSVQFIAGGHEHHLSSEEWDRVGQLVLTFCDHASRQLPPDSMPFDEAFYLRTYPGVAAAVAAGQFVSGEQHFLLHGRQEGRSFRLQPDARHPARD